MLTHSFTGGGGVLAPFRARAQFLFQETSFQQEKNKRSRWFCGLIFIWSRRVVQPWFQRCLDCHGEHQRPDADLHTSDLDNGKSWKEWMMKNTKEKLVVEAAEEGLTDDFILPADELWSRILVTGWDTAGGRSGWTEIVVWTPTCSLASKLYNLLVFLFCTHPLLSRRF